MKKEEFLKYTIVIEAYTFLALLAFQSLFSIGLDKAIIGDGGDAYSYVWDLWWVNKAATEGKDIFYTTYLFFPTGLDLHLHTLTLFWALITIPISHFIGFISTYNVLVLVNFVLSSFSMFVVSKSLTKNYLISSALGFFYGFSAYNFGKAAGHLDLQTTFIFPLILFTLYKLTNENKRKWLLLTGSLIGLTAYIAQYYFLFVFILFIFYLLVSFIFKKIDLRQFLIFSLTITFLASIIAFPYVWYFLTEMSSNKIIYDEVSLVGITHSVEDISLIDYFLPIPFSLLSNLYNFNLLRTNVNWTMLPEITISFIVLIVFLASRLKVHTLKKNVEVKIYLILIILFLLLSLGPEVKLTKQIKLVPNYVYSIFYYCFPAFNAVLSPARFSIIVFAILIFLLITILNQVKIRKNIYLVFLVILVAYFLETYPIYFFYSPSFIEIGKKIEYAVKNSNTSSVIDIPPSRFAMYFQIFHEKPIEDVEAEYVGRVNSDYIKGTYEKIDRLISCEECDDIFKIYYFDISPVPVLIENSKDYEIFSFDNKSLTFVKVNIPNKYFIFGSSWYSWEQTKTNETMRWMSKKASIYLFSRSDDTVSLNFTLVPYKESPLKISLNDKVFINTYLNESKSILIESVDLKKGVNKITIEGDCKVPALIENSIDRRCLSFALINFRE